MIESRERVAEPGPMNPALIGASRARAVSADFRAATRVAHPGPPALDWLDRQLLEAYQRDFPICEMPFAEIASRLRCRTSEVLRRLAGLERHGVVSRIGPVFAPGRLDARTLAAMAVPQTRLDSIAEWVNRHRAVDHIYEREHEFNLWFVLAAPNAGELYEALADIRRRTGLDVLDLRLERDYHIDLGSPRWGRAPSGHCRAATGMYPAGRRPPLDAPDRRLVGAVRDGLSLTARPYAVVADRVGLSEAQVMERLRRLMCEGVIARMGMVVHHHELGYRANAMVVFDVPSARADIFGERLAQVVPSALCSRRTRRPPVWPYNLHCVLHGRNRAEVRDGVDGVDEMLSDTVGEVRRTVLFSRRRFRRRDARHAPDHALLQ